jgi:hypothetical protein
MFYNKKWNLLYTYCILIIFSVGIYVISFCSETLAKTKVTIEPMLTLSGQMDTNFFRTEDNEREVYTYLIQPGLHLGSETPKSKLHLYYTLDANLFEDKSSVPEGEKPVDEQNYIGHIVNFDGSYSPFEKLTLLLNDQFNITRRPIESDYYYYNLEEEKYWVNRFTPGIFYYVTPRFSAGLRYRRTDLDYYNSEDEDYIEHRALIDILYNPTRTTTLDLDYQRWTRRYREDLFDRDYTTDWIRLVGEKRFKHFSFDGGIGYHEPSEDAENQDVINWLVSATWQNPPPPEETRLLGSRIIRAKSHIYAALENNFNNLGDYYDVYVARRFTWSIAHFFLQKLSAGIRGYHENNDYQFETGETPAGNIEGREDDISDISANIAYLIKEKMSISFTLGHEKCDSNLAGYDYENDYYMLHFNVNYDITGRGGFSKEASYYR